MKFLGNKLQVELVKKSILFSISKKYLLSNQWFLSISFSYDLFELDVELLDKNESFIHKKKLAMLGHLYLLETLLIGFLFTSY